MKDCGKIRVLFDFTSFGKNLFLCFTGSRQYVVGYAPVNKDGKEIEWGRFSKLAATRRA